MLINGLKPSGGLCTKTPNAENRQREIFGDTFKSLAGKILADIGFGRDRERLHADSHAIVGVAKRD